MADGKTLLEMSDVAALTGFSVQRCRRILKRAGIAQKFGGRWVTTREELKENYRAFKFFRDQHLI